MIFLFKKMFRSVRRFKLQFASVMLLAMLSVVIFSGLEGVYNGIETQFNTFADETSLADEWVFASYFTPQDITAIESISGMSEVSQKLRITASAADSDGNTDYLSLDTMGSANISSMKLTDGKDYDPAFVRSVWLDPEYAEKNGIKTGQSIDISFGGKTVSATVAGLGMSAERSHYVGTSDNYIPEHSSYGYGFMSDDLPEKLGVQVRCNLLVIKSSGSKLSGSVNELLGERLIAYYDRDSLSDVTFVRNISGNLRRISLLFSALFILLSVLSMRTTIKRLIDAQSGDITTLKSLGFSAGKLTCYYSLYGLFVSIIGTALGYLASFAFSNIVLRTQKAMVSLPSWQIRHTPWSLAVILLIVALSAVTSVLAARKALRGLPAESAQQKASKGRTTLPERFGVFRKTKGFGMRWTLRDASMHKSRILLGIISVCGSFMLLIVGSGTPDSIGTMIGKTYSEEFVYEYKLTLSTANSPEQTDELCEQLDGQLIQTVQGKVTADGESSFKPVTVFSEGEMLGLKTAVGETLAQDRAYITEGMADELGIEKGDRIGLFPSMSAQSFEFTIAGIVPSSMPQSLYIGSECWKDAGAAFRPTNMLCGSIDADSLQGDTRISQISSGEHFKDNLTQFSTKFTGVFTLMKIVALMLVVIVLYNLSTLSFIERTRQYNTFRVLGFRFGEIRRLASFENIIILLFGTLIGIPFGYKFLDIYCANFSNDTMKFYPVLKGISLAITCVIVIFCTAATTLLLSRRIKKTDMVQALKQ